MRAKNSKAVMLEMQFGGGDLYGRFLDAIAQEHGMEVSVLRARVTPAGSWMWIELRAASEGVDRIVRAWRGATLTVIPLPATAA